jgi:hypothetical protein
MSCAIAGTALTIQFVLAWRGSIMVIASRLNSGHLLQRDGAVSLSDS